MPDIAIQSFALWLSERCEFLHNLEEEAERVLLQDKNTDKYKTLMCQKAMFLQALPDEAEKLVTSLPDAKANEVLERLDRFSANASRALGLDSVFYMSALLYPENHRKGEPNDLDRLAAEMRALADQ